MPKKSFKSKAWRIGRALVAGLVFTLALAYAPAVFRDFYSYLEPGKSIQTKSPPTYLGQLAPPFSHAELFQPNFEVCSGLGRKDLFLYFVDRIVYTYGDIEDPEWIMKQNENRPQGIQIWRERYGWPFRAIHIDGATLEYASFYNSVTRQDVQSYEDRLAKQTGYRAGVRSPSFFPCDMDYHYIPTALLWMGLLADTLFWGICWLIPGFMFRKIRTARRERRGICSACGYSIEGLDICPECGSANSRGVAAR